MDLPDSRQADTEIVSETLAGLASVFELAYASWRERLLDQSSDGVPWADLTGNSLYQEFLAFVSD